MTQDTIINRLTAEALHQTTVEGMRQVISMTYTAGHKDGRRFSKRNRKKVILCDLQGNEIRPFNDYQETADYLKVSVSSIKQCLCDKVGRHKTVKGFKVKYA